MAHPASPVTAIQNYRVLARKYRPRTFSEMIGQESLVRVLSNGLESGRLPHAFVFTGIRGVGKTTTARIMARSLNCVGEDGQGGPTVSPCGLCDPCQSIMNDRSVDVIEMDAASQTGVDDIREIIDSVRYKPVAARYKVYIIDEVHMLSKNAFNALLKTLEEPPAHVKFIFATTEIRKMPATVLSRCMRFDLRRLGVEELSSYFSVLLEREGVQMDSEGLELISRFADGSVRDGLSMLDQAINLSGTSIEASQIREMLGLNDRGQIFQLWKACLEGEIEEALKLYGQLYQFGCDAALLLQELLDLTHSLTCLKVAPTVRASVIPSGLDRQELESVVKNLSINTLTQAWQLLMKGLQEVQTASSATQACEMALIRLAYGVTLPPLKQVIADVRNMQAKNDGIESSPSSPSSFKNAIDVSTTSGPQPIISPTTGEKSANTLPQSFQEFVDWVGAQREPLLYAHLVNDVRMVSYAPLKIVMQAGVGVPADFQRQLSLLLGPQWAIEFVKQGGNATLAEQRTQKFEEQKQALKDTPLVQGIMQQFPGASLKTFKA